MGYHPPSGGGGGGGAPASHHASHETGGADALAHLSAGIIDSGTLADARLSAAIARASDPIVTMVAGNTDTGTKTAWAPGLSGDTSVTWAGASDLIIQGLAGGVSGQLFWLKNTGAKTAWWTSLSGAAAAGDQIKTLVTSSLTPVAPGGMILLQHDGTRWNQMAHAQGAMITSTFSAADFTASAGSWTVGAGDVINIQWKLTDTKLEVVWAINTTDLSVAAQQLKIGNGQWGGFTVKSPQSLNGCVNNIPGLGFVFGFAQTGASSGSTTQILIFKSDATNFPISAANLYTYGSLVFEVN